MNDEACAISPAAESQPQHRLYDGAGVTLGLNLMGHDVSYTILDEAGAPILVAEEERYSRRKRGTFVPSPRQVFEILEEAGVSPEQVRHIAVANIPELIEQRPHSARSKASVPVRFGQAACFNALFRAMSERLGDPESVMWLRHHLCHAASAFLPSPYEAAAVVTVDGMGEDETATVWSGEGTRLKKVFSVRHPHSLGYVYQAVAQWAGMTGAEREGKLMGLASLGEPRFVEAFREHFISRHPEGGFVASPSLASRACDNQTWLDYCEQHLGPRRLPGAELQHHHMDVAASVQALLEETLQDLLNFAARLTNSRYCCVAGGVFMNSMANGRLRREGPFDDLWVQPMASDNGLSLGAALWSHARRSPSGKRWEMTTPFLGTEVTPAEIEQLLGRRQVDARRSECVEREVAALLARGKLVGWVQGRCEVGARALGHRSIFADPRDPRAKDRLNAKIKLREDWRPFAPVALEEDAGRYFADSRPSPFMTFVTPAVEGAPIPAALHVDSTARAQTVSAAFDRRLHHLLREFRELTGVGVLLNTSFNVRGEPIVRTAEDAYAAFANSGMDVLVLGDYIIEKPLSSAQTLAPRGAPPPRVRTPEALKDLSRAGERVAVVSLGSPELLDAVLHSLPCAADVWTAPPSAEPVLRELLTESAVPTPVSALDAFHLVLVLLPTWVEVAAELTPNLVAPFLKLRGSRCALRLFFLDEAGGMEEGDGTSDYLSRLGSPSPASEVEHFWFHRRGAG